MRLGKIKLAFVIAFLPASSLFVLSQPLKEFRYVFNNSLNENFIVHNDHSLTINYTLSELDLQSITRNEGTFFRIRIPGHIPSTEVGKPELPVLSRLITIPDSYTYKIRITDIRTTIIKPSRNKVRGLLYPAQEPDTKENLQKVHPFALDNDSYSRREFLKSDTVKIVPLGIVRHKKLANLYISPVRYNPHLNRIEVITSMKIEIIFSSAGSSGAKALIPESRVFNETLGKGVLNYNADSVITGYSEKPVRMIILTDTTFRKLLKPFIKWKTQKGFKVEVLYKGAAYAGDNFTSIKNTLTSIYNSSTADNPPPEYLLIIGDVSKVPYYNAGTYEYPTDMFYGEYDGNGDYIPDIFVGRLPAKDTIQLKTVLNKIIQYEKYDFASSNLFSSNALITAGVDGGHEYYMNGQVYYGATDYLIADNKINGYHFYYPTSGSAKDSIIKLINKGVSFINYTGHGTSNSWLYMNISTTDIKKSFTNKDMYPFVISNACYTSAFYDTLSFGNKMVTSKDKGAIGFIGCSDESFWDEDYYWAVGVKPISSQPVYSSLSLGAFDRFFHTHGETASDWYITMGQVNYAGNLSVSSSTSNYKKYYWENYNLVGDPSVIPIIGTPGTFDVTLPDTLPNNIKSYSFISEPFSYVAVSHFDTLWDASYASASGTVTLKMPGLSNDSCLVVITGQNKKPIIKTIYFSNINNEFINLASTSITDPFGNNDGKADFGEQVILNLTVDNMGGVDANSLYAKISSTSPWLSILNDSVIIGTLQAGGKAVLNNIFHIEVSENVPDKEIITLNLTLKDSRVEKEYKIDVCAHAPNLEIVSLEMDDSLTGNGNFFADPGETVNLIFKVSNKGSAGSSGQFSILCPNPDVDLLEPTKSSGDIPPGEITDITLPIKLSDDISIGTTIFISANLNCKPNPINKDFSFRIGRLRESFESSTFRVFPWINISSVPWTLTSSDSYDGKIAARSGKISNNQSTSLSIRTYYETSDSIRFRYKVSSEFNYDFLYFKLNGVIVFRKSGEVPWTKVTLPVPSGYNKLEWVYAKDANVSSGLDCAMIDMIDFAESGLVRYIERDIYAARIVSPIQKDRPGLEPVTVKLLNLAPDTINGFNLAYTINDGLPVSQYFNNKLIPFGDTVSVTFSYPANLSKYGIYKIAAYSFGNNDDCLINDTITTNIKNTDIHDPLKVYPNPFTDELQVIINTDKVDTVHITIASELGVVVADLEKDIVQGKNVISLKDLNLTPSVYYMRITYSGLTRTIPIIKIR